jgi:Flp pilus assembly pilin Flp
MAICLHYRRIVTSRRTGLALRLAEFGTDDSGADLIEYTLVAGVIAGGCVLVLTELRDGIIALFSSLLDKVPTGTE